MKALKVMVLALLLGSLTIEAEPIVNWLFQQSYFYENGRAQESDDVWEWTLHCNDTVDEEGPPYEMDFALVGGPDSRNDIDMAPLVAVGGFGRYWCAASTWSNKYSAQSNYTATEKDFIATAQSTGFVPLAPTW